GRILAEEIVVLPVARRANRAGREATATIGTDIAQHRFDADRAERAFVAANTGLQRRWWQRLVAVLAAWPQLEHQCIRAAASAFARRRLSRSGASRSRRRCTRSAPAFSGLPESNGGCGPYSSTSWIDLATSSPASSAAAVRPKTMPAGTPPPPVARGTGATPAAHR